MQTGVVGKEESWEQPSPPESALASSCDLRRDSPFPYSFPAPLPPQSLLLFALPAYLKPTPSSLRNPTASAPSRYLSILPAVARHRRTNPPSARMVSTTVSSSSFYFCFCFLHEHAYYYYYCVYECLSVCLCVCLVCLCV